MKNGLSIVTDCILLACGVGIAMDLVTAHVAVEYFTVHHPKVVESTSPLVMALVWGIGASWWFGAGSGIVLAIINARRANPLEPREVRLQMSWACAILWLVLMLILGSVYGLIGLIPDEKRRPSFAEDRRLMAVALTHMTEYVLGAIALIVVAIRVARAKRY